jgi:hypothetical protein
VCVALDACSATLGHSRQEASTQSSNARTQDCGISSSLQLQQRTTDFLLKPQTEMFLPSTVRVTQGSTSTKWHSAAPRDSASRPTEPVPAGGSVVLRGGLCVGSGERIAPVVWLARGRQASAG